MVKGANPTIPHMVLEFLIGRRMQSREPMQRQQSTNKESQDMYPLSWRQQTKVPLQTLLTNLL